MKYRITQWMKRWPLTQVLLLAFAETIVIESLNRRTIFGGIAWLFSNPGMFFFNMLIILLPLCLAFFFHRRVFVLTFVSTIWLVLATTNFVLKSYRVTPLGISDFQILRSVAGVTTMYLSPKKMVMVGLVLLAVLIFLILLWSRAPKTERAIKSGIGSVTGFGVLLLVLSLTTGGAQVFADGFTNIENAYQLFGFTYCFTRGVVDRGIDKPSEYSEQTVDELLEAITKDSENTGTETPNVIFLQLESFFDVNRMNDLTLSKNPIPVFTELKENFSHGLFSVPSVGAGTANTEFECITGMNLDFFGAGEYPYKTVLQDEACETLAYNLKELGYKAHAIHNNKASFYDRNVVFSDLGFDTFTSIEFMNNVEYTPVGWAKDAVLTEEIMKALESTKEQDFIYTITVQAHGKYLVEEEGIQYPYQVLTGLEEDPERKQQFEYFMKEMAGTDAFLGELVNRLTHYSEKVVLVLYGDHLPSLGITQEELKTGTLYDTEYVIWSNYDMVHETKNLQAYQMGAYLMEKLGFKNGILTKLHQNYSQEDNYLEAMKLAEYDMLYGENTLYGGVSPYAPTKLQMGTVPIRLSSVQETQGALFFYGEEFTPFSVGCIDGEEQNTIFLNSNTLMITEAELPEDGVVEMTVIQKSKGRKILAASNEFYLTRAIPKEEEE